MPNRHVLHGGSWDGDPGGLRSAVHFGAAAGSRDNDIGFRVAKEKPFIRRGVRGGSWDIYPGNLRLVLPNWSMPDLRINVLGFRVAKKTQPPSEA